MTRRGRVPSRAGQRVSVGDLRVGERVRVGGHRAEVTCLIRGAPFVRWMDERGRESELLELREQIVEVLE